MLKSLSEMCVKEEIQVEIDRIKAGEILPSKEEMIDFIYEIKTESSGLTGVDKKELLEQLIEFKNKNWQ